MKPVETPKLTKPKTYKGKDRPFNKNPGINKNK